ncbi:alpha-amylase family glycosyl hydrolase [Paraglaciecola hydrolytica]|uniref:Alpha-amlyase n=1 Tax=Paraglaciecola hydrolytica TaxID=1799789 RepID=A0A148KLY4_9ALTE|nr:alpha-amylase family glycosyl hydrolase [Paraglaciecola hydrolytica]KXI27326.1 alpha-amlyase [Paraglaciecola hydrolytica]
MATISRHRPQNPVRLIHPDWCKNAVMYQINTRQFTKQGTFSAAIEHLPRLKDLGIDIIYLMPINPIGLKNRKGSLGSPYAVQNYLTINPEFGTIDDFKALVNAIHAQGMYVIVDWVANHSAWDNVLVAEQPQWYSRDHQNDFHPTPWWDWHDIIDFDYSHPELREYMAKAMCYWVKECDIDGYRCDVAGMVPTDFWVAVRQQLEQIKPVLMLAEWETRDLHYAAFDMTYAWMWNETLHGICMGKLKIEKLFKYYSWHEKTYPKDAIKMTFVSNHDKNAWDGTQFEQFGEGLKAAIVLSVLGDGMPLIYNGQEAGNPKRLAFFDRDPIEWRNHEIGDLYQQLITIKKSHSALANGQWGATMLHVANSSPDSVFSFVRQDAYSQVLVVLNLSAKVQNVCLHSALVTGSYRECLRQELQNFDSITEFELASWDYRVWVKPL